MGLSIESRFSVDSRALSMDSRIFSIDSWFARSTHGFARLLHEFVDRFADLSIASRVCHSIQGFVFRFKCLSFDLRVCRPTQGFVVWFKGLSIDSRALSIDSRNFSIDSWIFSIESVSIEPHRWVQVFNFRSIHGDRVHTLLSILPPIPHYKFVECEPCSSARRGTVCDGWVVLFWGPSR